MEDELIVSDMHDVIIQVGDKVRFYDPEIKDYTQTYEVYDIHSEELIKLTSKYGECEALPEECEVIWDKDKITRWVDECADGCAYELLDHGGFPFTDTQRKGIFMVENDSGVNDSEFADYVLNVALNNTEKI